jgi:hypothetical protein
MVTSPSGRPISIATTFTRSQILLLVARMTFGKSLSWNVSPPLVSIEMTDWPQNSEFWFDQSELDWDEHLFEANPPLLNHEMPAPLNSLTAMMQDYLDRKSRPSSPSPAKASKVRYSAPPLIENHNRDIIRVFQNVFKRHIPKTFSLFEDAAVTSSKCQPAFTLALAATGGLFCTVPGSARVAKSMYDNARRMVLSIVG